MTWELSDPPRFIGARTGNLGDEIVELLHPFPELKREEGGRFWDRLGWQLKVEAAFCQRGPLPWLLLIPRRCFVQWIGMRKQPRFETDILPPTARASGDSRYSFWKVQLVQPPGPVSYLAC